MATVQHREADSTVLLSSAGAAGPSKLRCHCGLFGLLCVAFALGAATATAALLSSIGYAAIRGKAVTENVDFSFQIMGIQTPRQGGKAANVFVRFRYEPNEHLCPFSATDNVCPQYQHFMRSAILNITMNPTPELLEDAEWERVNLAICRTLWDKYSNVVALSTSFHVNGDGRNTTERGGMPYEPGAHGSTCTISPDGLRYEPIQYAQKIIRIHAADCAQRLCLCLASHHSPQLTLRVPVDSRLDAASSTTCRTSARFSDL